MYTHRFLAKPVAIALAALFAFTWVPSVDCKIPVNSLSDIIVHPGESIQDAIDESEPGTVIRVCSGTYFECLTVDKACTLVGNGSAETVIDGETNGHVITITADWVNITGLGVRESGGSYSGIYLEQADYCALDNISVSSCFNGIYCYIGTYCGITNVSVASPTSTGIYLYDGDYNIVQDCSVALAGNNALFLDSGSRNNIARRNLLSSSGCGVRIETNSHYNTLYNNDLNNNALNAQDSCTNTWSLPMPAGGNFWSDWCDPDANSDGLVDIPHGIPGGLNTDRHPWTSPGGWRNPPPEPVRNLNTDLRYWTISSAVSDAATQNGHTVFVDFNYYYEQVTLGKTVRLLGNGTLRPVLEGGFYLTKSNTAVENFTVRSGFAYGYNRAGMYATSWGNRLANDTIEVITGAQGAGSTGDYVPGGPGGMGLGIHIQGSGGNVLVNVTIHNIIGGTGGAGGSRSVAGEGGIGAGLLLQSSPGNVISGCSIRNVTGGTGGKGQNWGTGGNGAVGSGLEMRYSSGNTVAAVMAANILGGAGGGPGSWSVGTAGGAGSALSITYSNITSVSGFSALNVTGGTGGTGSSSYAHGPAGDGRGIGIMSSQGCAVSSCSLSGVRGGKGAPSQSISKKAGKGGLGAGIYLAGSACCDLTDIRAENVSGGEGGKRYLSGPGGDGGDGYGLYASASSSNGLSRSSIHNVTGGLPGSSAGVAGHGCGLNLSYCSGNQIFRNSFTLYDYHAWDNGTNYWNATYPGGGNFWGTYQGWDNCSGPEQDKPGRDGYGDQPYQISGGANLDRSPLMSPLTEFTVQIHEGWNLVSIPLLIADRGPGLLSSIDGLWTSVRAYDASDAADPWKGWTPSQPAAANDLQGLDLTMGFWLKAATACNLTVLGIEAGVQAVPLRAGWNLVGYPTMCCTMNLGDALWGTMATMAEGYSAQEPCLIRQLSPSYIMKPGEGYWVHVLADSIWNISW